MSGVAMNDSCLKAYGDMQLHKGTRYRFTQMKIDGKEIVIDKQHPSSGCSDTDWEEFRRQLPENEGRFVVYDWPRKGAGDGTGTGEVLIFIAWCPDTAPVRAKMLYASTAESIK